MEFIRKEPLIILIAGKARSGKSTLSKYLQIEYEKQNKKVIVSPYTKYLKLFIEIITGSKINEENKPRDMLQQISSKIIKDELNNPNFFIDRQIEDIKIYSYFADVILIPDVRFPNEISNIKDTFNKVISIGITRKNYISILTKEQSKDVTETALDDYHDYDFEVENTDATNLQDIAKELVKKINERRLKKNITIAIDGPAGSGKGALAKALSQKLNLVNIDTGATYRCVALKAIKNNISLEEKEKIIEISKNIDVELMNDGTVLLDGEDVTKDIRSKEVTEMVSPLSSIIDVRENLVNIQRKIAEGRDVVMEGRDITTVVLPKAKYKIYLDASLDCRVARRFKENQEKGIDMTYEEVYNNIQKRDYNDLHKEVGSLARTNEQIYIDTTYLTIEEEVAIIEKIVKGDE